MCRLTSSAWLWLFVAAAPVAFSQQQNADTLTYTQHITPILKHYCLPCHAAASENPSGLALDTFEYLMKGGNHGAAVVPGKPEKSYLYLKLLPDPPFGKQMARNKKRLTKEELKTIYDWIAQGARKD